MRLDLPLYCFAIIFYLSLAQVEAFTLTMGKFER
jgi:hypothetical protein